jgi:hypothetical protein
VITISCPLSTMRWPASTSCDHVCPGVVGSPVELLSLPSLLDAAVVSADVIAVELLSLVPLLLEPEPVSLPSEPTEADPPLADQVATPSLQAGTHSIAAAKAHARVPEVRRSIDTSVLRF